MFKAIKYVLKELNFHDNDDWNIKTSFWKKQKVVKELTPVLHILGFSSGSVAKNPPAMWEMQVWSLCGEDTLEGDMATHPSIHAWRIPRT